MAAKPQNIPVISGDPHSSTGTDSGPWRKRSEIALCPQSVSSCAAQRTAVFLEPATRDQRGEGVKRAHFTGCCTLHEGRLSKIQL